MSRKRTYPPGLRPLVLCLGNDILSDDGFGIAVGRRLAAEHLPADVETSALGGFHLLDYLAERDRVLIVDIATIEALAVGELRFFTEEEFTAWSPEFMEHSVYSQHGVDLPTVLALGRTLHLTMPARTDLLLCGARDVTRLSEDLTAPVRDAVPRAVAMAMQWVEEIEN